MRIFILERKVWDYDEVIEIVVLAETLKQARQLAHDALVLDDSRYEAEQFQSRKHSTHRAISVEKPTVISQLIRHG